MRGVKRYAVVLATILGALARVAEGRWEDLQHFNRPGLGHGRAYASEAVATAFWNAYRAFAEAFRRSYAQDQPRNPAASLVADLAQALGGIDKHRDRCGRHEGKELLTHEDGFVLRLRHLEGLVEQAVAAPETAAVRAEAAALLEASQQIHKSFVITSPNEPFLMKRGTFGFTAGLNHFPFNRADGRDRDQVPTTGVSPIRPPDASETTSLLDLGFSYAMRDDLTLRFALPVVVQAEESPRGPERGTGAGDIRLGAAWWITPCGRALHAGADVEVHLPTGDEDLDKGSGTTFVDFAFKSAVELPGGHGRLYTAVGHASEFDEDRSIGSTQLRFGSIWNLDPFGNRSALGRAGNVALWGEMAGEVLDDRTVAQIGLTPVSSIWQLRGGAAFLLVPSFRGLSPGRHLLSFEMQVPVTEDGIYSSWSWQLNYGFSR